MYLFKSSKDIFFALITILAFAEIIFFISRKRINEGKSYLLQKIIAKILLVFSALTFIIRALTFHRLPAGNLYEISILLIILSLLVFFILPLFLKNINYSFKELALLNTLLLILGIIAILFFDSSGRLTPILYSYWLPIHVSCMIFSYSFFSIAFVISIYQLFKKRLNNKQSLQNIYNITCIGYILFTLSVIFGALWANSAWGNYWQWDPKETWALITWLLYTLYLHLCSINRGNKNFILIANVVAYSSCIFNLFIVNTLIAGMHSYAQ